MVQEQSRCRGSALVFWTSWLLPFSTQQSFTAQGKSLRCVMVVTVCSVLVPYS